MERVPTSAVLGRLLEDAPEEVTIGWIMGSLRERSFGMVMFLLGLIALVPGLSALVGALLVVPAGQMMLARHSPALPAFVARRRLPTRRFSRLIGTIIPLLRWIEKLIRPRWATPIKLTKRVVGAVILLLGLTLVAPIPLSNVIPAVAIMLIALGYLEEDGVMLAIALAVALASVSMTAGLIWATVAGIVFLDRF